MWRRVLRWLAALFLTGAMVLPVWAQDTPPAQDKPAERRPPAFEYALSIIGVMVVLLIICMPTRKR